MEGSIKDISQIFYIVSRSETEEQIKNAELFLDAVGKLLSGWSEE